jgi:hypothetical protein
MSTAYSFVGSDHVWFGVLDSASVLAGTTGTVANGADAGMGRLNGVESVGYNVPESRVVGIPGDNGLKGAMLIPPNTPPEGSIVTSIADLTFQTQAQSLTTRTLGDTVTQMIGPSCPVYKSICLIVNSPALDHTAGNVGAPGFHSYVFFKNQIQPRGAESIQNGNAATFPHRMVGTYADKAFWGESLPASSGWGTLSGLILDLGWSPYPWTAHRYTGDNSTTSFTSDETPAAADGNSTLLWQAGTLLVYGSGAGKYEVVTATKTWTFGTAPGTGVKAVALYRYIPSC